MENFINQIKRFGTLVLNEEELMEAGFNRGKKVLTILKNRCVYCHALIDSWTDYQTDLFDYLHKKEIGLIFIEKFTSEEFAVKRGDGIYPNVNGYLNGEHVGWKFTELYEPEFEEWLKKIYSQKDL
ncbi:Uncharacterised protein [uncultured archaeon]|nr:Uncharacterised protein [uncultured archaeon]